MRILSSSRTLLLTSRFVHQHILRVRCLALLIRLALYYRRLVTSRLGLALGAKACITLRTLVGTGRKSATFAMLSGTKQRSATRRPETVLPSHPRTFVRL